MGEIDSGCLEAATAGGALSTMFNALGVLACVDCMLAQWLDSAPGGDEGMEAMRVRSYLGSVVAVVGQEGLSHVDVLTGASESGQQASSRVRWLCQH